MRANLAKNCQKSEMRVKKMEGIPKVSKKTDQKSEIKVRNAENSL